MLAPKENRSIQLDSVTAGGMVNGMVAYFHDGAQIKKQFREGELGHIAGFDWFENERGYTHANGSDVSGSTDATSDATDGGNTLDMQSGVTVTTVGSVFTIADVHACHPETKKTLGYLQQFTILTGTDGELTISPSTYWTGPRQNMCTPTSEILVESDFASEVVTFVGAATTAIKHQLAYQKEWATFVTADLPLMASSEKCVRRVQDGLSLRCWTDSDIRNDEMLTRIDILYGHAVLRPEWGCRITN